MTYVTPRINSATAFKATRLQARPRHCSKFKSRLRGHPVTLVPATAGNNNNRRLLMGPPPPPPLPLPPPCGRRKFRDDVPLYTRYEDHVEQTEVPRRIRMGTEEEDRCFTISQCGSTVAARPPIPWLSSRSFSFLERVSRNRSFLFSSCPEAIGNETTLLRWSPGDGDTCHNERVYDFVRDDAAMR